MSSIRRFFSAIGEGLVGLWRNISMGIASIVSICSMLLILGGITFGVFVANNIVEDMKTKVDQIDVILEPEVSTDRVAKIKEELKNQINKIEEILQNSGLKSKKSYFRQEQTILANLPLNKNNDDIKKAVKKNILTDGIRGTYPFITSTIYDEKGILYGTDINSNSLIIIDKFDREKYKNSNTCIFGSSGSGKSYFTKIQILRNYILNINQYIIDPEREYEKISKSLNGSLIKIGPASKTYINIFDIREDSLEENEEGYLATKLNKLMKIK